MKRYFAIIFFTLTTQCHAQIISLDSLIKLAQSKSPKFQLAQAQKELKFYQYKLYKANLKPQISFYATAPVYNKEFYGVRQPDGTISFLAINQNNSNAGFNFSQQLLATGGEISLHTDLTRFDDFDNKSKQYNGTPVYIQLSQPLFGFNQLKWSKKIEPLVFEESKKQYQQDMQEIALQTARYYFDILEAQNNNSIAQLNVKIATTNYDIEQKRINLGTTTEDKLLQLEFQVLSNQQLLNRSIYDIEVAQLNIKTFLSIKDQPDLMPLLPDSILDITIHTATALSFAKANRAEYVAFQRRLLESQQELNRTNVAKKEINLIASYGLNKVGNNIADIYQQPNNQQRFSLGVNIPIVDWGRRKAQYQMAKTNEKLVQLNIETEERTIEQQIVSLVKNYELLKNNIDLAKKTDTVALRRFKIANSLYQIGKLSTTELFIAQGEKDSARRNFISVLRQYWETYYLLRYYTGHDF